MLSRNDLELDWRTFYRLVVQTYHSPHFRSKTLNFELVLCAELPKLICCARVYFSKESTSEMLTEWKQYLCIYSHISYLKYMQLFSMFLPTLVHPEEHQFGFKLWFQDFMNHWLSLPKTTSRIIQEDFIFLFAQLAVDANG